MKALRIGSACFAACLATCILGAGPAMAFSVSLTDSSAVARWPTSVVTYYLQALGSDDLTPQASVETVRKAFQSWVDIECSDLTFVELGDVEDISSVRLLTRENDGRNDVIWLEDDRWTLGRYVLGVTTPWFNTDGVFLEADIIFNGYQISWSTDGHGGTDLESVAVHEIGHMFGMQHNLGPYKYWQPPTLAPNVAPNEKSRSLEPDDEMGICFLYPAEGAWTCADDTECPYVVDNDERGEEFYFGKFHCTDSNECGDFELYPRNISGMGEWCQTDESCASAEHHCQPYQDTALCTTYCDPEDPQACLYQFLCKPFEQFPQYGACIPLSGEVANPGEGPGGCQTSQGCVSGKLCLPFPEGLGQGKKCVFQCDPVGDSAECAEGDVCHPLTDTLGGCFVDPAPPEPEPGPEPGPEAEPAPEEGPTPDEAPAVEVVEVEADAGSPVAAEATVSGVSSDDGCAAGDTAPASWLALLALLALGLVRRRA